MPYTFHGLMWEDSQHAVPLRRLCMCCQAGVQLLFLVGNDAWASSEDTKEILQLLGCPKALSTMDVLWVRAYSAGSPAMLLTMTDLTTS